MVAVGFLRSVWTRRRKTLGGELAVFITMECWLGGQKKHLLEREWISHHHEAGLLSFPKKTGRFGLCRSETQRIIWACSNSAALPVI